MHEQVTTKPGGYYMLRHVIALNFDLLIYSLGRLKEGIITVERHSSVIGEHLVLRMTNGRELSIVGLKQELANDVDYLFEVMNNEGDLHRFSEFADLILYVNEVVLGYILGTV